MKALYEPLKRHKYQRNHSTDSSIQQQNSESLIKQGQYMPKNIRMMQMSEIRQSHFTLGYAPTTMVTSNKENSDQVQKKWNAIPTQSNFQRAKIQNFNINNGSQVFHGNSSNSIDFGDGRIRQHPKDEIELVQQRAETLRKSSIPFNANHSFTTTNTEHYKNSASDPYFALERKQIVNKFLGAKANFTLGLDQPNYITINQEALAPPQITETKIKELAVKQSLEQRQHNFKMSFDQSNYQFEDKTAQPKSINVSQILMSRVQIVDLKHDFKIANQQSHTIRLGKQGVPMDFITQAKEDQKMGIQNQEFSQSQNNFKDAQKIKQVLRATNFDLGNQKPITETSTSQSFVDPGVAKTQVERQNLLTIQKEKLSKLHFALGPDPKLSMNSVKTSTQVMSTPLLKRLDEGGPIQTNTSFMLQFAHNDRLDSVKLGSGLNTDYTSHSQSTFIPKNVTKPRESSESIKQKIQFDHLAKEPDRHLDVSKGTYKVNMNEYTEARKQQTQDVLQFKNKMITNNIRMGSTLSEHQSQPTIPTMLNRICEDTKSQKRFQMIVVKDQTRVSAGNIGGAGLRGDYNTINQQQFKWIQPIAHMLPN